MKVPFSFIKSSAAAFVITDLSWDGLWMASYSGSPWAATASAGTSGSNGTLVTVTGAPTTGTAVNSLTPATFDGAGQALGLNTAAFSDMATTTALTLAVLFKASASVAAATDFFDDEGLAGGSDGNTGLVFTSSGVRAGTYVAAATHQTTSIALATSVWALAVMRYDGTNIKCRVSQASGTTDATPVASGSLTIATNMYVGRNYSGSDFLATDILMIGASKTAFSDADLANLRSDCNTRYALSLT